MIILEYCVSSNGNCLETLSIWKSRILDLALIQCSPSCPVSIENFDIYAFAASIMKSTPSDSPVQNIN